MQSRLSTQAREFISWKSACVLLLVIAGLFFTLRLGSNPFIDYDEAIYAPVIKYTAQASNPFVIQGREAPFFDKPPLYYWAGAISQRIFSSTEFAYRLPAAIAGLLCITLVMLIVFTITRSFAAAFVGGFTLFTTALFFESSRQVRLETLVTSGILLTFYAYLKGSVNPKWYMLIGVGLAVGVLTKSVIGLLSLPIILIWAIVHKDFSSLRNTFLWIGLLIGVVLVIPWHLMQTILFGSRFWNTYLGFSVIERFQGNVNGGMSPTNALYFFYLATFAFPWTWAGVAAAIGITIARKRVVHMRPIVAVGLATSFLAGIFLLAGTKLPYYMIPALAFLSIFLGCVFWAIYSDFPRFRTVVYLCFSVLATLALVTTVFVGFHYQKMMWTNDVISANEYEIAKIIGGNNDSLPIYTYEYPYWDTIAFYSDKPVQAMEVDQLLDKPFYLVVRRSFYSSNPFPAELQARLLLLFEGDAAVLLKFQP